MWCYCLKGNLFCEPRFMTTQFLLELAGRRAAAELVMTSDEPLCATSTSVHSISSWESSRADEDYCLMYQCLVLLSSPRHGIFQLLHLFDWEDPGSLDNIHIYVAC